MAKKARSSSVSVSFHYIVKSEPNENDPDNPIEAGFTVAEFSRVINRISNPEPLNVSDQDVIRQIKHGHDLPFSEHEVVDNHLHFGKFEGAYYGQRYRNNILGVVSADSLNLRSFFYLITRLRDGKILIGVTYHGQFGDYDGISKCLTHILRGNYNISSRTLRSISGEIGNGVPVQLNLTYRKTNDRPERRNLFGRSGVIAIKNTEFGDDFADQVNQISRQVRGDISQRKHALAQIINNGELLELNDEEIVGCTAIVRDEGRYRTIYLLGENNFATKFHLNVAVDQDGVAPRDQVRDEIIRVLRESIMPMMG